MLESPKEAKIFRWNDYLTVELNAITLIPEELFFPVIINKLDI